MFLSNDASRVAFGATCLTIVLLSVLLRLWTRYCILPFRPISKSHLASDLLLVLGFAMAVTFIIRDIEYATKYSGLGRDEIVGVVDSMSAANYVDTVKIWLKLSPQVTKATKVSPSWENYSPFFEATAPSRIDLGFWLTGWKLSACVYTIHYRDFWRNW